MSDARITVQDTPKPPMAGAPSGNGLHLLLDHFWKLFAVVMLAGILYLGQEALSNWNGLRAMSMTVTNKQPRPDPYHLRYLKDKQSRPGAVVFKNQSPAAVGYLADANEDFVVLGTVYKDESREETILIPWENILYIRMNLKESEPKK